MMRSTTDRCQAIDIVRLYAMLAMLFAHAAGKVGVSMRVAQGWDVNTPELTGPAVLLGLVFHLASPTFALLTGFSLAFFVASRQRRQRPASEVDAYLIRRGSLLLVLALLVDSVQLDPLRWTWDPDILGMFAVSLWLLIPLRRLSPGSLLALAGVLTVAVQVYLAWRGTPQNPGFVEALLLTTRCDGGTMNFPVLPWLSVILVGFACGRLVAEGKTTLESLGFRAGGVLFGLWGLLHLLGHPVSFRKHPPTLDYLLPYLAAAFFLLALHARYRQPERWWFYRTFVVLGRCALLFYLLHAKFVLNGVMMLLAPLALPAPLSMIVVSLLSLAILVPICSGVLAWNTAHRRRRQARGDRELIPAPSPA